MKSARSTFRREYRLTVKKVLEQGLSFTEVTRQLGIRDTLIHNWKKQFQAKHAPLSAAGIAWIMVLVFAPVGLSAAESAGTPSQVTVGAYLNNVQELALKEHSYEVDLYIWFRWRDDALSPAESVEMVNPNQLWGTVSKLLYDEPVRLPTGESYQVLRVQGRFSRKFFFHNYPFDRQELVVEFEDSVHETNRLVYVADQAAVAMNPSLVLPGFRLSPPRLDILTFAYPTTFGDPRRSEPGSYSRARLSLPIARPILTSMLKTLLPVLCVGLGASLMLLLRTTYIDARLGIGITSLLTVVAIQLAANETMPSPDYLVLMDKIHLTAYLYVLVGLGVVLYTARQVERGGVEVAQRLQRRCFLATGAAFLLVVCVMVGLALMRG
jgi:transposase-like protein